MLDSLRLFFVRSAVSLLGVELVCVLCTKLELHLLSRRWPRPWSGECHSWLQNLLLLVSQTHHASACVTQRACRLLGTTNYVPRAESCLLQMQANNTKADAAPLSRPIVGAPRHRRGVLLRQRAHGGGGGSATPWLLDRRCGAVELRNGQQPVWRQAELQGWRRKVCDRTRPTTSCRPNAYKHGSLCMYSDEVDVDDDDDSHLSHQ